jgi:hypothetical protein
MRRTYFKQVFTHPFRNGWIGIENQSTWIFRMDRIQQSLPEHGLAFDILNILSIPVN